MAPFKQTGCVPVVAEVQYLKILVHSALLRHSFTAASSFCHVQLSEFSHLSNFVVDMKYNQICHEYA